MNWALILIVALAWYVFPVFRFQFGIRKNRPFRNGIRGPLDMLFVLSMDSQLPILNVREDGMNSRAEYASFFRRIWRAGA